jgi:hypothetical protein
MINTFRFMTVSGTFSHLATDRSTLTVAAKAGIVLVKISWARCTLLSERESQQNLARITFAAFPKIRL